jgi:hypothetical protein
MIPGCGRGVPMAAAAPIPKAICVHLRSSAAPMGLQLRSDQAAFLGGAEKAPAALIDAILASS